MTETTKEDRVASLAARYADAANWRLADTGAASIALGDWGIAVFPFTGEEDADKWGWSLGSAKDPFDSYHAGVDFETSDAAKAAAFASLAEEI